LSWKTDVVIIVGTTDPYLSAKPTILATLFQFCSKARQ